ncbi:hypothetical protein NON00_09570 [Roseomonas sp. GC11]|uniref:tautomerase family protein n=1 Tax=Roseomonas sp. GC11 TaxID=2950546 RepID=UPI002109564E|nr:hypothetical protein [Roseomonas sp. GC11]MCQ4160175.1 hypothetical protein [Roseomonas sp. GC11]
MPYVELLAPPVPEATRAGVARAVTEGLCAAFGVGPQTVTTYFLDIPASHYAHAGVMGEAAGTPRILAKVHAYRRDTAARRAAARALTGPLAALYGVPEATLAVYFIERARDEVAHGGTLACDAEG